MTKASLWLGTRNEVRRIGAGQYSFVPVTLHIAQEQVFLGKAVTVLGIVRVQNVWDDEYGEHHRYGPDENVYEMLNCWDVGFVDHFYWFKKTNI